MCTFRLFATSLPLAPEEIWRDYNQRADMEKRIAELKYDLAADDFCLKEFFATEAAFRAILLLFNLLSEFQRISGMPGYRQPATLRTQVFLCGAILGRAARKQVLPLCANNAETPYPCYISVEGRDEKEDGKKSNGYGGSRGGDPDDEWRRA